MGPCLLFKRWQENKRFAWKEETWKKILFRQTTFGLCIQGEPIGAWLGYPLPQGVRLSIKILCGWKARNQSHEMFQTCGIRLPIKILCGWKGHNQSHEMFQTSIITLCGWKGQSMTRDVPNFYHNEASLIIK